MIVPLVGAVLLATGCSRQLAIPADGGVPRGDSTSPPIRADGLKTDDPRSDDGSMTGLGGTQANPPFKDRDNLPAGTLITVRLKGTISVGDLDATNSFEATVAQPVVIDGNTLIPSGSVAAGHVESARISKVKPARGYVRLTLATIHVRGLDVPVQTASLYARQSPPSEGSAPAIRIEKGRGLTFRFTRPVYIAFPQAAAIH